MKIEIDKDQLLKAVNIADSVINIKNVNSVLSNCLFNVSKDSVEIISTDNEIGLKTTIDSVSDGNISFTTNGKILSQVLKELPKGSVVLDVDDAYSISIRSKSKEIKGNLKLVGTSKGDFPDINFEMNDNVIEIDQVLLKDMIRKVIFAASTDTVKPVFNGLFFVFEENNKMAAVASDSRRLSYINTKVSSTIDFKGGVIIPLKTINEVFKLLSSGSCRFGIKENQCFFKIGNTDIISRVIDGQFPNYKQVMPKDFISFSVLDTKKFTESLKRVMILTKEPTYKIILNFTKDQLVMESKLQDIGETQEIIDIEYSGNDISLGINSQYLMDSIKEIDSISFKISITGNMSPVTVTPENSADYVSVIMPIQIKQAD